MSIETTSKINEEDWAYFGSLMKESDRGCALLLASKLDEVLTGLHESLISRFVPNSKPFLKQLFRPYAPLSTFAAKISLAYAYGLMGVSDYEDLELIRHLRNEAAHSKNEFSFAKIDIRNQVMKLTAGIRVTRKGAPEEVTTFHDKLLSSKSDDYEAAKMHFVLGGLALQNCLMSAQIKVMEKLLSKKCRLSS